MSDTYSTRETPVEDLHEIIAALTLENAKLTQQVADASKITANYKASLSQMEAKLKHHNDAAILHRRIIAVNDAHIFIKKNCGAVLSEQSLCVPAETRSVDDLQLYRNKESHFCSNEEYHRGRYMIECLLRSEFANPADDSKLGPNFMNAVRLLRKRFEYMNREHMSAYTERKRLMHDISVPIIAAWIRKGTFVFD